MRLTTKGRYAVVAMVAIAAHAEARPIPLAEIAEKRGISLPYLEQLFCKLRRAGLVVSVRGPGGGYRLNRPAAEIAVGAIVRAVDENLCCCDADAEGVDLDPGCPIRRLWVALSDHVQHFLDSVSLADLSGVAEAGPARPRQALPLQAVIEV